MADQVLERFHRALIEEIQTQRPEYLTQPFTVAEIYQNLVPYGSHRERIGVEINGDYEDALVRLLAGEGGYLILDSEPALENLRAELDAPNPNTGVYREFAAVDVRLNQAYLDLSAEAMDQLPDLYEELEAEDPVTMTELAPAEGIASAENLGVVPPGVDIFGDNGPTARNDDDGPSPTESAGSDELRTGDRSREVDAVGRNGTDEPVDRIELVDATEPPGATEGSTDSLDDEVPDAPDDPDEADGPGIDADTGAAASGSRRPPLAPEFVEDGSGDAAHAVERDGEPDAFGSPLPPDGACLWCRADLPKRESLNFCPFCGTDVSLVPCPSCGAEIEPEWRFCAVCGTEAER